MVPPCFFRAPRGRRRTEVFKMTPSQPKKPPREPEEGPKTAQEAPKTPNIASKMAKMASNMASKMAKMASNIPKFGTANACSPLGPFWVQRVCPGLN